MAEAEGARCGGGALDRAVGAAAEGVGGERERRLDGVERLEGVVGGVVAAGLGLGERGKGHGTTYFGRFWALV